MLLLGRVEATFCPVRAGCRPRERPAFAEETKREDSSLESILTCSWASTV